jgi:hypothetical protein
VQKQVATNAGSVHPVRYYDIPQTLYNKILEM